MIQDFENKYNIKTKIDALFYEDHYKYIRVNQKGNDYDVFSVDVEWVAELVKEQKIYKLNKYLESNESIIRNFDSNILNLYSKYEDDFYTVPFILDSQNFFYRKDLFEDTEIKSLFYKLYKRKLKPPRTWREFDVIAQFFTRKFNKHSPVEYGITLSNNMILSALCGFMPRLWSSYNSKTFIDQKQLLLDEKKTLGALRDYKQSFDFATKSSPSNFFPEQAEELNSGKCAMAIIWHHALFLNLTNVHPEMRDKIGCERMPGGQSLLGGWTLAINPKSKIKKEAFNFIRWIVKDVSIPFMLLEGSSTGLNLNKSIELRSKYPFSPMVFKNLSKSNRLNVNFMTTNGLISQNNYRIILGEMIFNSVNKNLPIEGEVIKANNHIKNYLKNKDNNH